MTREEREINLNLSKIRQRNKFVLLCMIYLLIINFSIRTRLVAYYNVVSDDIVGSLDCSLLSCAFSFGGGK